MRPGAVAPCPPAAVARDQPAGPAGNTAGRMAKTEVAICLSGHGSLCPRVRESSNKSKYLEAVRCSWYEKNPEGRLTKGRADACLLTCSRTHTLRAGEASCFGFKLDQVSLSPPCTPAYIFHYPTPTFLFFFNGFVNELHLTELMHWGIKPRGSSPWAFWSWSQNDLLSLDEIITVQW